MFSRNISAKKPDEIKTSESASACIGDCFSLRILSRHRFEFEVGRKYRTAIFVPEITDRYCRYTEENEVLQIKASLASDEFYAHDTGIADEIKIALITNKTYSALVARKENEK